MKQIFSASQFTPTQWDTAEDKAKFANHLVRFIESGFKQPLFYKWFYRRLSMTFGHIAHYNSYHFYTVFFQSPEGKRNFLNSLLTGGGYGDPAFTYSDVEKVIKEYVRTKKGGFLA